MNIDSTGHYFRLTRCTNAEKEQFYRAIEYLKTSADGQALYEKLNNSNVCIWISFNDQHLDITTPNVHSNLCTIKFDPYSGLTLEDGVSTQSSAVCLAHEMGHVAQYIDGYYYSMNYDEREVDVISKYETPIATQLQEPTRASGDVGTPRRMNNSTHYITSDYQSRPVWHYLLFWKLFRPNYSAIEHNAE